MEYRVVFTDHTFDTLDIERTILEEAGAEVVDGEDADGPLDDHLDGADAVIVMYETIDADRMDLMPDCQIVSRTGIGVDNVDLDAATERGIHVTNVPDYCIPEVSDHTMALLLALERKIVDYNQRVKSGEWDVTAGRTMHRLSGQTLGLVAFGDIARAVCKKATAFGMDVVTFDPYLSEDDVAGTGATLVDDLETLLEQSDTVSVHTPLTPETEGMISTREFAQMKDSAFIINPARGGIIDESALTDAIENDEIAGAGLDVLADEPPEPEGKLMAQDEVILTPHAAWNSAESVVELREKAAWNVRTTLEGGVSEYVVNDEVQQ